MAYVILIALFLLIFSYSSTQNINKTYFGLILIAHVLFSILFLIFFDFAVSSNDGYFENGLLRDDFIPIDYRFAYILVKFSSFFSDEFLFVTGFFNLIGFLGLILIFDSLSKGLIFNKKGEIILIFLFCLPSMHFWSGTLSREGLQLLGIGLIFKSLFSVNIRWVFLIVGIILSFCVRPQIGVIFGLSGLLSFGFLAARTGFTKTKLMAVIPIIILGWFAIEVMLVRVLGDNWMTLNLMEWLKSRRNFYDEDLSIWNILTWISAWIFPSLVQPLDSLYRLFFALEDAAIFGSLVGLVYYTRLANGEKIGRSITTSVILFFLALTTCVLLMSLAIIVPDAGVAARQRYLVLLFAVAFLIKTRSVANDSGDNRICKT